MNDTVLVDEIFGLNGCLARQIKDYRPRHAQSAMASGVSSALAAHTTLVAEAGTGTGKTFAYLVPALLGDGKVVISTGTKNLQDQLFFKDLPLVKRALGQARRVALLKGRRNYLCRYRLDLFHNSQQVQRENLHQWA
ncbi:MAG: ATP-dependent DNA helicase, partial [Gammaproteobacteria bacterium]|nr:ATP-dependent DNA helicase [Gammaproteobacteria bacterium]